MSTTPREGITNAAVIGRNSVNAALDLLAMEVEYERIDDLLATAIGQLEEARARIDRAIQAELAEELATVCGAWKTETGLCLLRAGHSGTRHLDTVHNKSWPIGESSLASTDGRL